MVVLVCGGRNFHDRDRLYGALDKLHKEYGITVLVHGNAKGADLLSGEWADERNVPCRAYPIQKGENGFDRNRRMAGKELDGLRSGLVVAFPGGAGTKDMVRVSRLLGIRVVMG